MIRVRRAVVRRRIRLLFSVESVVKAIPRQGPALLCQLGKSICALNFTEFTRET